MQALAKVIKTNLPSGRAMVEGEGLKVGQLLYPPPGSNDSLGSCVLQPWVLKLSWKQQTVLLCALRGPDAGGTAELKAWVRFIRRDVLHNAAPKKTFMQPENPMPIATLAERSPLVFDMLPVHYLGHLMHALQVMALYHPQVVTSTVAKNAYEDLCTYLHLNPETEAQMEERLKDEL